MKTIHFLYFVLMFTTSCVQTNPEVIPLYPNGVPGALGQEEKDMPKLYYYGSESAKPGPAVVICPGGGYEHLAMEKEGFKMAKWFNTFGMSAIVLQYRLGGDGYKHPIPLEDVKMAMRTVRSKAKEWNLDENKIGVIGFSAGGHLASTLATHWDDGVKGSDDLLAISSKPNFAILGYPVITLKDDFTHKGSRRALLGDQPDSTLVSSLSNETQVTNQTPPTFLFHTYEDGSVPVQNSLQFYAAMVKAGVPGELHVYQKGGHGLGFGPGESSYHTWRVTCEQWLRNIQIIE
ncbi:alpha/beta hydrolase [Fulvivirga ligni]|uniref:alpha/beta hydrolase n=1 Tax=Fulvivirga ligni TaxID=2904246 RepID=UPI001F278C33|nr:alpha/beta hydrolase [Fulvivirga ligni]UII23606.1 alpha/beta hydrolase [Fulvivirga ligni]